MSENRTLPPGVKRGADGDYTCLVSDDGTHIQLCGVWYLDAEESKTQNGKTKKGLVTVNGTIVCVCQKCGCRVAFANDRFCRGCGKEFEN